MIVQERPNDKDKIKHYKFKVFLNLVWEICNNNDDVILFINGARGSGKSMAGLTMLRYYLETFIGHSFTEKKLREHIVYEYDHLSERAKYLPKLEPILVDEGVRVAYTGDFAAKETKDLIKFFAQCRTKNRFVIFVSPDFTDIAKRLRNYAKYRIRMVDRGLGVLFSRDNAEGVEPFHLDTLYDLEKFHDYTSDKQQVLDRLRKHVCYKDQLEFPLVPKEIQDWYGIYRDEAVYSEQRPVGTGVNDKIVHLIKNLRDKWKTVREEQELTWTFLNRELCYNPVNKEPFWAHFRNIAAEIRKLELQVKVTQFKKDKREMETDERQKEQVEDEKDMVDTDL